MCLSGWHATGLSSALKPRLAQAHGNLDSHSAFAGASKLLSLGEMLDAGMSQIDDMVDWNPRQSMVEDRSASQV